MQNRKEEAPVKKNGINAIGRAVLQGLIVFLQETLLRSKS
jgi:hypothetical protein